MINVRLLAAATLLVAASALAPATVAAKSGDVVRTGGCSGSADWKLKAGKDDGRIEVEFEVDSNRNGQVWRVKIRDNGVLRYRARQTTQAPSGSFSVERRIAEHGRQRSHRRPRPQPRQRPGVHGQPDDLIPGLAAVGRGEIG